MRSSYCVSCRIFACKTHSTSSNEKDLEDYHRREQIVKKLLDHEQHYLNALEELIKQTIQPLIASLELIFDFRSRSSSPVQIDLHVFEELRRFHGEFLQALRQSTKNDHRLGQIFVQWSSMFEEPFQLFAFQYAKILFLFRQYRHKFNHSLMRANFALPLNHLDTYVNFLTKYFQSLEEFHLDRQKTQQAIEFFTQLIARVNEWRKRKEWELDILHSPISETLQSLGEALHLSSVDVLCNFSSNPILQKRIALIYSTCLVFLSSLPLTSSYRIENRFLINQLIVSQIRDDHRLTQRILKINTLSSTQSWIILFANPSEYSQWCEKFRVLLPIQSPHYSLFKAKPNVEKKLLTIENSFPSPSNRSVLSTCSKTCLRPHSPLRPHLFPPLDLNEIIVNVNENRSLKRFFPTKKNKDNALLKRVESNENDSQLLSVIEAYCLTRTDLSLSLVPTTTDKQGQSMREMLNQLRSEYKVLQEEVQVEKRARQQLQSQIERLFVDKKKQLD